MTLLAQPLIWLVRGYQVLVSRCCRSPARYFPSCSAYGLTALRRFGLVRGGYLTVHRIVRCNPWSAGGIDHVPETWAQRGSPDLATPRFADVEGHDDGVGTDATDRRTFTT